MYTEVGITLFDYDCRKPMIMQVW